VRIYERQGALLHAKTDRDRRVWATVGSSQPRLGSFVHNAEANAIVLDARFGASWKRSFRSDLHAATRSRWPPGTVVAGFRGCSSASRGASSSCI
jgi:cardiolipin synthase